MKLAICISRGKDCGDLRRATVYRIVADPAAAKEGYLRVIDDSGDDYLYPAEYFVLFRLRSSLADQIAS